MAGPQSSSGDGKKVEENATSSSASAKDRSQPSASNSLPPASKPNIEHERTPRQTHPLSKAARLRQLARQEMADVERSKGGGKEFWDHMAKELEYGSWMKYLELNRLDPKGDFLWQSEGISRLREIYFEHLVEKLGRRGG